MGRRGFAVRVAYQAIGAVRQSLPECMYYSSDEFIMSISNEQDHVAIFVQSSSDEYRLFDLLQPFPAKYPPGSVMDGFGKISPFTFPVESLI